MKAIIPISVLIMLISSCGSNDTHEQPEEVLKPKQVSVIYPDDSIVFVLDDYADSLENSPYFFQHENKLFFNARAKQDLNFSVPVKLQRLDDLITSATVFDMYDWLEAGQPKKIDEGFMWEYVPNDTIRYKVAYRLWWNADCTKKMPGFKSDCMGTFGKHIGFGTTMQWTVGQYTVCGPGKGTCLEKKKQVGTIRYYNSNDCSGRAVQSIPIERFTCN